MRHRLTCPLYDEHPKHLRVLNHLDQFSNNDRGRELATLAVAGYELLYGKGETAAHPQSLDTDIGMLLARMLGAQNQQGTPQQAVATPPSPVAPAPDPEPASRPPAQTSPAGPAEEPAKKEAPPSRPKPPSDPTPPSRSDLSDEPPTPEDLDDDDDDHIDSLSLIGSKFG